MSIYDHDWDPERQQYVSGRKVGKPLGLPAWHPDVVGPAKHELNKRYSWL